MKRNKLWLSGLLLAGLLTMSHSAEAGGRWGLRPWGPRVRHEVVVVHPGRAWVAGYRGWDRFGHGWFPGRWIAARPGWVWRNGGWRHGHNVWGHREGYWRSR